MALEIKFRAWDGKQMHYDDLGAFVSIDGMTITPVRCEIMQYTGKTCNKVEVYERDKIHVGGGTVYEVVWSDDLCGFVLSSSSGMDIESLDEYCLDCCEIVGNTCEG